MDPKKVKSGKERISYLAYAALNLLKDLVELENKKQKAEKELRKTLDDLGREFPNLHQHRKQYLKVEGEVLSFGIGSGGHYQLARLVEGTDLLDLDKEEKPTND